MRYHGGKFRIAGWVASLLPPHRVYVEPYGGAGSVLLRKPRAEGELYNDMDGDVVNVFRVLRDEKKAERLRRLCELTPHSREDFEACYPDELPADEVERARLTVARAFMAFGTTSRRKNRTGFRSAVGKRRGQTSAVDWSNWPNEIPRFVERLRGVTIENRPALEVIAQHDNPDVLFYVDPPYPISTRSSIRSESELGRAYHHDLTDDEHRKLAEVLNAVKGAVVLSGYRCELYDELFKGWARYDRETRADGGLKRTESIWRNERAESRDGFLF